MKIMKYFILSLFYLFLSTSTFAYNPQYKYNNRDQQYSLEKSIYQEIISQTLNTKCTTDVNVILSDSFLITLSRSVYTEIFFYKDKKLVAKITQEVNYNSYSKFKYSVFQTVNSHCK